MVVLGPLVLLCRSILPTNFSPLENLCFSAVPQDNDDMLPMSKYRHALRGMAAKLLASWLPRRIFDDIPVGGNRLHPICILTQTQKRGLYGASGYIEQPSWLPYSSHIDMRSQTRVKVAPRWIVVQWVQHASAFASLPYRIWKLPLWPSVAPANRRNGGSRKHWQGNKGLKEGVVFHCLPSFGRLGVRQDPDTHQSIMKGLMVEEDWIFRRRMVMQVKVTACILGSRQVPYRMIVISHLHWNGQKDEMLGSVWSWLRSKITNPFGSTVDCDFASPSCCDYQAPAKLPLVLTASMSWLHTWYRRNTKNRSVITWEHAASYSTEWNENRWVDIRNWRCDSIKIVTRKVTS